MACSLRLAFLVLLLSSVVFAAPLHAQSVVTKVKIELGIPEQDLVPARPLIGPTVGILDLEEMTLVPEFRASMLVRVPEIHFQDYGVIAREESREQLKLIGQQIAKIRLANGDKTDPFVELLVKHRPDLAGLPFLKGDACKLTKEESGVFFRTVLDLREAQRFGERGFDTKFKVTFRSTGSSKNPEKVDSDRFRIAAVMQILVAEQPPGRQGLVPYLAGLNKDEATVALTRLAIFPFEDDLRQEALAELKKRDTKVSTPLLLQGIRYPYPLVAHNTAEVIVKLQRNDLVRDLVTFLDEPDPLAPVLCEDDGGKSWVVREMVRVNHHRNCLLCHAPANVPTNSGNSRPTSTGELTGTIPIPGAPIPSSSQLYYSQNNGISVRPDITYLRQDFTRVMFVENSAPWPEWQRYDFLVRTRALQPEEAAAHQHVQKVRGPEYVSFHHRAAVSSLEQLTGERCGPTATAWRKKLGLTEKGK